MKKAALITLVMLFVVAVGYGCARTTVDAGKTDEQIAAATATIQANLDSLPDDLPIHADAENLKFAAANTYITYEVFGTVDEIVEYYRDELQSHGWEKRNNSPEAPIGGALTLLRSKTDKNISITVQSIPDSEYVRVLINLILK
jgi:hypothetical protein